MRILAGMAIIPTILVIFVAFIIFNIFVAVIGIISLVLLIKRIKTKKKSNAQVVVSILFIISAIILAILWSLALYPDFYGQGLSSIVNGKEIAAIEYRDIDSLEKYLEDGWMIDENQDELIENLMVGEYSAYYDDVEECNRIDEEKLKILDLLLEYGYDENSTLDGLEESTLLTYATTTGKYEAVEILLKHGANVNDLKHEQGTILHKMWLVIPSNTDVNKLKLFIENGVDSNIVNEEGITGKEHLETQIKEEREKFENADYSSQDIEVLEELEQLINNMN